MWSRIRGHRRPHRLQQVTGLQMNSRDLLINGTSIWEGAKSCTTCWSCWRLKRAKTRPSAICFAETRTSPADQARITRKLQVLGYSCFWSPSVTSARRGTQAYWRGGLCIATARHVPCRQVAEWSGDASHIIALDYESFRAVGIWRAAGPGPLAF